LSSVQHVFDMIPTTRQTRTAFSRAHTDLPKLLISQNCYC